MLSPDDTIVALSSAPGPGSRAIIRISGPATERIVASVFQPPFPQSRARQLIPGSVTLPGLSPLPVSLYLFHGPRSYTGQDLAELHTISSPPLVERLIAELLSKGARPAQGGEFTLRAFLAGKLDLTQAEAVHGVIEAASERELKQSLTQLAGGVRRPFDRLRDDLLNLLADVEAGLDFVEEDIEFVEQSEVQRHLMSSIQELRRLLEQFETRSVSGRPPRAVLVGRPNAGKSSLFNALTGERALVSPVSGTTRDYLSAVVDLDGVPLELLDTAGWAEATSTIEEQAQTLASEQSQQAEWVLWCVAVDDRASVQPPTLAPGTERLLIQTKVDLLTEPVLSGAIGVSVCDPASVARLRRELRERVQSRWQPALAPSLSRCRHHVEAAIEALTRALQHVQTGDSAELLALELRLALEQIGEMSGHVYTNDLLDRIFSRFCIGK